MSELISQADSEFQRGNFEEASGLYATALEELEGSDGTEKAKTKTRAAVLQKLADSDYALNKFEQARKSYAELISLQESAKTTAKDRVSALLKFAKCLDKCDANQDAAANFQAAYDLAKSELSEKHFLRQSVADAYVDWLKTNGSDPERLAALREELGIAADEKEEKAETDDEVKPENITAPQVGRVAKEQEYHVMRSKITELKEKKKRKRAAAADDEESAEKKALKAKEKTIETKVSERKFLRKGEDKQGSDQRNTQRNKLRSAMTNKREASAQDAEQFSTEAINAAVEEQIASGTYPVFQAQNEQAATGSRFAEEMQISNEVREKFIGQKPSRRLDQPENSPRKKRASI
ncbi:MAG TPA: tetratricopeptide repeat protein [Chroococcales cyanobacterium]